MSNPRSKEIVLVVGFLAVLVAPESSRPSWNFAAARRFKR